MLKIHFEFYITVSGEKCIKFQKPHNLSTNKTGAINYCNYIGTQQLDFLGNASPDSTFYNTCRLQVLTIWTLLPFSGAL